MSLKERDRLSMFSRVRDRQLTLLEASGQLGLSYRQTKRLWGRYRQVGDGGLIHGLRGRASNNRRGRDARREQALGLYRAHYQGFGPTLAAEQMGERQGLAVDHETLRGWLTSAGLWKPKRQPRRHHRRRPRPPEGVLWGTGAVGWQRSSLAGPGAAALLPDGDGGRCHGADPREVL